MSPEPACQRPSPPRRPIAATVILANLAGAAICTFYFLFIEPLGLVEEGRQTGLWFSVGMTIILLAIGTSLMRWWMLEVTTVLRLSRDGRPIPEALLAPARAKVINAPLAVAVFSVLVWLAAAVIMAAYAMIYGLDVGPEDSAWFRGLRVFLGALISGIAAAGIIFFQSERVLAPLRPIFFSEGRAIEVAGGIRITVRARLFVALVLTSALPLLVVALAVYNKTTLLVSESAAREFSGLGWLLVFMVAVSLGLARVLGWLLSANLAGPVHEMDQAMGKVRRGDFQVRLPVRGNDELGSLAATFNTMIQGLAERDRVKETFGRFVTPAIAQAILSDPPHPGGQMTEVSVLFSDIRNYTTICENLPPGEVIQMLNDYFGYMVAAVEENQGLVYQFVGDGIMAVFGAPVPLADHATWATRAGLAMLQALERFNQKHRAGQPPLRIGIGVHTGPVVAGIIGTSQRMEYRVVGDTVNLAARVEGLNKDLGTDLLLTAATRQALIQPLALRGFPPQAVKGRRELVEVFTLLEAPVSGRD